MSRIEYWLDLATYDMETAKAMYTSQRYMYVGFMCHQVMEKALKAYYVKATDGNPPYTHNLAVLAEKAGLDKAMTDEQKNFLDFLEPLNIEARYPTTKDKLLQLLTDEKCAQLLQRTEGELAWITQQLEKK